MAPDHPQAELATVKLWLLDTGPLLAYLDRADPEHRFVTTRLDSFSGQFCTTSAVITEAMHFVSENRGGPAFLLQFLRDARVKVYEHGTLSEISDAVALMQKYFNVPMDYADATIVSLADRIELYEVCTLDRRGFSIFRGKAGKYFKLVLD